MTSACEDHLLEGFAVADRKVTEMQLTGQFSSATEKFLRELSLIVSEKTVSKLVNRGKAVIDT